MKKYNAPQIYNILIIVQLLFLGQVSAQNWDIDALKIIHQNNSPSSDKAMVALTNTVNYVALGLPASQLAYGLVKKDKIAVQKGVSMLGGLIATGGLTYIFKKSINRPRPFITYPNDITQKADAGSYAMPSGHTSLAFCAATTLTMAHPKWYVALPSYAWAGTMGYSRLHLGVHYPSDVLAGAAIGAGCGYAGYKLNQWINKKRRN